MKLKTYLKQAYPKTENKWRLIVLISLFISAFLLVFQPFSLNVLNDPFKFLKLLGYGLVTFLVLTVDMILLQSWFKSFFSEKNWTLGREILNLVWIIFSIGLGNAVYSALVFSFFELSLIFLLYFQVFTLGIGIFPIVLIVALKQNFLLKRHQNSAQEVQSNLTKNHDLSIKSKEIQLTGENEKEVLNLNSSQLICLESVGNYTDIYYLIGEKLKKVTFRSSLKRMLFFLKEIDAIKQCHRAFLINLNFVQSVKGNAQGLKLKLKEMEFEIPVSRTYVSIIQKAYSSLKE